MRTLLFLAALLFSSRCGPGSYVECGPGLVARNGECSLAVDATIPEDASDAGNPDAGPCGGCSGERSRCDEMTGRCVECLADVECSDVGKPFCDEGTCAPCAADTHCERFTETPVCDESGQRCVQCTGDTEAARCGLNSCRRSDGTCTMTVRGGVGVCESCQADSECGGVNPEVIRRCVRHTFMGTEVGTFCFFEAPPAGCGDADPSQRPYRTRVETESIDGVSGTYCLPPASTTCAGIRDTQSKSCTSNADCGVPELDDGYCPPVANGARLCTYRCAGAVDCDSLLSCGDAPAHCRP